MSTDIRQCSVRYGPIGIPCEQPATCKLRGKWWCEEHANDMELVYETEDEAGAAKAAGK